MESWGFVLFAVLGALVIMSFFYRASQPPVSATQDRESAPILPAPDLAVPATPSAAAIHEKNQRAFVIAKHNTLGYLVLYAYKSRKGGRHGQIPGGRVDEGEMREIAAVRELREETGIEVPYKRLSLLMHLGEKHFYLLELTDEDSVEGGKVAPLVGGKFRANLSSEHQEYSFVPTAKQAANEVAKHSGGACAHVLHQLADGGALL